MLNVLNVQTSSMNCQTKSTKANISVPIYIPTSQHDGIYKLD